MNSKRERADQLIDRTKSFAIRVVRMYSALPKTSVAQTLGKQVLRSGTSIGAHCREARRSRSKAEFISKLQGALQEADETGYWLELLVESDTMPMRRMTNIIRESDELTAILTTVVKGVRNKNS